MSMVYQVRSTTALKANALGCSPTECYHFQTLEKGEVPGKDWLQCSCGRWLHADCVSDAECFINICQMHVQLYSNLNVIDMCDVRRMYKDE